MLNCLSGDVLGSIAEWLESEALGALVFSGDATLNHKLANHVRSVKHFYESARHFTWPFFIRRWTALTHLSVHPGYNCRLDTREFVDEFVISPTLATRVLDSLPRSLVSLQLDDWPLMFKSAFRSVWERHVATTTTAQMDEATSDDNESSPSETALPPLSHTSGTLVMLQRFYLPNLQRFTMNMINSLACRNTNAVDIRPWINCATNVPLTHLSLCDVSLSNLEASLCNIFLNLPRSLTSLTLKRINNANHRTTAIGSRKDLAADAVEAPLALPPHLTYLKLDFFVPPITPVDILSNLSHLQTLKLGVHEYESHPLLDTLSSSPSILSHLPASVHTLSLTGYLESELHCHLNAIPDAHRALRHLTVKPIKNSAIRYYRRSIERWMEQADWIRIVTSHAKFWQLESFHPHVKYLLEREHEHDVNVDDRTIKFISQNKSFDVIRKNMAFMTRLRSVSDFFLHPIFLPLWDDIAPHLTSNTPMNVCCDKKASVGHDEESFTIFTEGRERCDDNRWLIEHWAKLPTPAHFTTERLAWNNSINMLVYRCYGPDRHYSPCTPQMASVADTLCKSVKHLLVLPYSLSTQILTYWPYALEALTITSSNNRVLLDLLDTETIQWDCWTSVSALCVLIVNKSMVVSNLNALMQALPKTLEKLKIENVAIACDNDDATNTSTLDHSPPLNVNKNRLLSYMPPRLKCMKLRGNFVIDKTTFDAIPSSLRNVRWSGIVGVHCRTSNLSRWPKHMHRICIHITTLIHPSYNTYDQQKALRN